MGRPTPHPKLGAFFAKFRRFTDQDGWSADANYARRNGYKRLSRQVLMALAGGKTKSPNPEVLREFAGCYGIKYETLVATVVDHVYGVRLARSTIDPELIARLEADVYRERQSRVQFEKQVNGIEAILRAKGDALPLKSTEAA